LHDGVIHRILLQLPKSFTYSVSYANQGNFYLKTPLGIQNLNNKEKTKGILVVVVKWRQRANLLLMDKGKGIQV